MSSWKPELKMRPENQILMFTIKIYWAPTCICQALCLVCRMKKMSKTQPLLTRSSQSTADGGSAGR